MSTTTAPAVPKWRTHAACRGTDPALFYDPHPASVAAAKTVCDVCPVRNACRNPDGKLRWHQPSPLFCVNLRSARSGKGQLWVVVGVHRQPATARLGAAMKGERLF